MAKKAAQQQLQADIQTDEDLERFLDRPGLLVLDVYSEWCGPCIGLVGSLRKFKLESGGDNLHLAICKSDTITSLKRFNKKSEPVWLLVTGGKAVGLMFGSDVPKLIGLISRELEKTVSKAPRPAVYRLDELQPLEVEQQRIKMEAIERAERAEREIKHKKQVDYLTQVTDSIMENMPDIGVTVFGPQVNRDMFKKLTEPAEPLKMQCKDRRVIQVTPDQFEIVNFSCKNPMPPDVIEQLDGKELLMCFWKIDESIGTVPNVLMAYAHELTKERVAPPNDEIPEEHVIPPIITTMKLKVEVELKEGEVWVEEISSEEEQRLTAAKPKGKSKSVIQEEAPPAEEEAADLDAEEEASEEEAPEPGGDAMGGFPSIPGFDMDLDGLDEAAVEDEEEVVEVKEEEPPKPLTRTKTVKMPPIWVPNNRRTHAALVYVFFRGQTTGFLPPDPKPEPPHVIMAFDASKRKEIMNVVDRHKDDVPLYGYFSSAEPDEAELIANSTDKYESSPHTPNDKIVLKVNKVQSNMMLSLVSYGPSYVSPNVNVGKDEALKFFPEDYKLQEEVVVEPEKKKKKSKKGADLLRESVEPEAAMAAAAAPPAAEAPAPAPAPAPAEGEAPAGEVAAEEGEAPAAEGVEAVEGGAPPVEGGEVAPPAETGGEAAAPPAAEAVAPPADAPPPEVAPEAPKEEAPPVEAPPPEPEHEAPAEPPPAAEPAAE
ncbi:fibrous sheath CABYR-binding protein [Drosophila ficusphila]|uniref:fibrous sheath CABYR-binding protein n=1 Tax=Drosophila ficusphila TaxID=30025 RepID=UPI0007E829E6|nr:fibrous sheath CABYR-binding protein [Drosophila ficusphila]